jgi:WD40 repeat protein
MALFAHKYSAPVILVLESSIRCDLIVAFTHFQSEVNAIKWDPTGSFLASCSDDWTAKVLFLSTKSYAYD